jgi:hypothetical protein
MKYANVRTPGIVALLYLVGCNSAQSPQTIANDIAAAAPTADAKLTDARDVAAKANARMRGKIDHQARELNNAEAKGAYDIAVSRADGIHTVALEQCWELAGNARKPCKAEADTQYEVAKTDAKAAEIARRR